MGYFHELLITTIPMFYVIFIYGEYCQQVDEIGMGSTLVPSLTNMFLCDHEQIWLDNCPI